MINLIKLVIKRFQKNNQKFFDVINLLKYDSIRDIELEIKKKLIDITDNIENKKQKNNYCKPPILL